MKRHAVVVVVGWILVGGSSVAAQGLQCVDLITNGGFEDEVRDWQPDTQHERIEDAKIAHSGEACLTGEVTEPNQALRLRRSVPVRAGNRYEFHIWAKATNRTKLVLWSAQPGGGQRTMVASWPDVTRQWRLYSTPIAVSSSGVLDLEIITPSSHAAPAGRIWIDDIALYETQMPPVVEVTRGAGFNDEPAMAAASDGSAYVAYNRFIDGADSLQVQRYRLQDNQLEATGQWQVLGGSPTYLLGLQAVSAGSRVAIVYAAEREENWDIHAVMCGPDGPEQPVAVTTSRGVDTDPCAAWHDDRLWVAWETNRDGRRQIYATSLQPDAVQSPIAISPDDVSSYDPTIAVLPNGEVCVAWHAFRANNYDIYLRRRSAAGQWEPVRRLTQAPTIDRHAQLLSRGRELWIVYENAQTERYHVTRTNRRRLVAAQVTPGGLMAPVISGRSPLDARCEAANALFDNAGRLWVAMLKPRLPRAGWDVFLAGLDDRRWLGPIAVSGSKGMDRKPGLVIVGNRALVSFQGDDMPQSWSDLDAMAESTSDIYVASLQLARPAGTGPQRFEPLAESDEPFEPAEIRLQRGEDSPTPSITYHGKKLQLFYGDLHEHSDVSVCNRVGDQSLDESYQHLRDLARHDFVCITDHGYNINPYLWNYSAKLARVNDDPGRFVAFLGQEWTSTFEETSREHPHGFYGHRNLILSDLYFPTWWNARNRQTPNEVWEDLRRRKADFVHIPHQLADTGNVPTDWHFHDEVAQPVAEIFQTRGSYEYDGAPRQAGRTVPGPGSFLHDAWAQNIVIGVIASPDHGGGYGKACVFAEELSRESILDALRARRCYGTTAAKIFVDARFNGHLMGEKLASLPGEQVKIEVTVRAPTPIDKIEVCRSNEFIDIRQPEGTEATVVFVDSQPLEGRSYYYVRVMLRDEEIAWTSPVWFGVEPDHAVEGGIRTAK